MVPSASTRLFARLALLTFAILGVLWLVRLDFGQKLTTSVTDLLPAGERDPDLDLLHSLANDAQSRVVLLALSTPPDAEAASRFIDSLRRSPAFAEVALANDPASREELGRFIHEHRFRYLLPGWLAERHRDFAATDADAGNFSRWLAERVAGDLDSFLARPESAAFADLIPLDPLLLLAGLADNDTFASAAAETDRTLIWARLTESPFSAAGQHPAFSAIDAALAESRVASPEAALAWTGVNRFAAASEKRIRGELSWINTLSVVAVLAVVCLCLRRPWQGLHLLPIVTLSLLGAWVAVTLVFDRVHVLVFVVGALLTGAAIDYGFHLFLHAARARQVLRPLLTSCLTTVIGFSLLWFSSLPLVRHLGVFVSAGLLTALGVALLYFAQFTGRPFSARTWRRLPASPAARLGWRVLLVGVLALSVFGALRLRWHDDIRELEVPAPELHANDRAVRAFFGETPDRTLYFTRGSTLAEARRHLADFATWHDAHHPESPLASAAVVLPTASDHASLPGRLRSLGDFETQLRRALDARGYLPDAFLPFFNAWREARAAADRPDYDQLVADLRARLTGQLASLLNESDGHAWLASFGSPPSAPLPPELRTVPLGQLRTLNALFTRYRADALRLALVGLALVGFVVVVLHGPRRGLRIFAIPAGACLVTFGALGLFGATANLFHLLGAFLGVCLSVDYAVFAAHTRAPGEPPPPSIRVAALTTTASFGVLAFSAIPVVSALGVTVCLLVLASLAAVEIDSALR